MTDRFHAEATRRSLMKALAGGAMAGPLLGSMPGRVTRRPHGPRTPDDAAPPDRRHPTGDPGLDLDPRHGRDTAGHAGVLRRVAQPGDGANRLRQPRLPARRRSLPQRHARRLGLCHSAGAPQRRRSRQHPGALPGSDGLRLHLPHPEHGEHLLLGLPRPHGWADGHGDAAQRPRHLRRHVVPLDRRLRQRRSRPGAGGQLPHAAAGLFWRGPRWATTPTPRPPTASWSSSADSRWTATRHRPRNRSAPTPASTPSPRRRTGRRPRSWRSRAWPSTPSTPTTSPTTTRSTT